MSLCSTHVLAVLTVLVCLPMFGCKTTGQGLSLFKRQSDTQIADDSELPPPSAAVTPQTLGQTLPRTTITSPTFAQQAEQQPGVAATGYPITGYPKLPRRLDSPASARANKSGPSNSSAPSRYHTGPYSTSASATPQPTATNQHTGNFGLQQGPYDPPSVANANPRNTNADFEIGTPTTPRTTSPARLMSSTSLPNNNYPLPQDAQAYLTPGEFSPDPVAAARSSISAATPPAGMPPQKTMPPMTATAPPPTTSPSTTQTFGSVSDAQPRVMSIPAPYSPPPSSISSGTLPPFTPSSADRSPASVARASLNQPSVPASPAVTHIPTNTQNTPALGGTYESYRDAPRPWRPGSTSSFR